MLLQHTGLQPPASAVLCFSKSPHRDRPFSVQTCGKLESCQLASSLETCQSGIRGENLCDEVIIILIFLLSSPDRYVTSHLLQKQQTAVHAKQICMNSSQPSLVETQLQAWIYPCTSAMKFEGTMKAQILERLAHAARPAPLGLHRDPIIPARFLLFGYMIYPFHRQPSLQQIFVLLLFYSTKKRKNRFSPSHAKDRGMAQHYLLAILPSENEKVLLLRASRKSGFQLPAFSHHTTLTA